VTDILAAFSALQAIYSTAEVMREGEMNYVFIPRLPIQTAGNQISLDALLCPQAHGSYSTRLFLEREIPGRGSNWTTHQVLGRTWRTWSYNNVSAAQPLVAILASHLKALA